MGDLLHQKETSINSKYGGSMLIKNSSTTPKSVKVFQREYQNKCSGDLKLDLPDKSKNPRSNAAWISFSPQNLTVPPNGISRVNYTVDVPNDTLLKGSYFSAIIVEEIVSDRETLVDEGAPTVTPKRVESKKTTVRTINKTNYVFLIVSDIEQTGNFSAKISNPRLFKTKDNHRLLSFEMENDGEKVLKSIVWVELYNGSTGLKVRNGDNDKFMGGSGTLPPGSCTRKSIDLGIIPSGNYKAIIMVDAGGDNLWGSQYNFVFDK